MIQSDLLYALFPATGKPFTATGISIDTRTLQPGDLFVALSGERYDGHVFVQEAEKKGAAAVLVHHPVETSLPTLMVDNTLDALVTLAKEVRRTFQGKLLALTGSVGKTSVKEGMLHLLGSSAYGTSGNFNGRIGVPLVMARMDTTLPFAVFELGMTHKGGIAHLKDIVQPHVAMLLNASAQHAENFSSVEEIAKEKASIYTESAIKIVYHDDPHYALFKRIGGGGRWISFGRHKEATISYKSHTPLPEGLCRVTCTIEGQPLSYTLQSIGDHWITNSLAILAGALALGLDIAQAAETLASFSPLAGRGKRLILNGILVIDDTYNAAPAAMHAGLHSLLSIPAQRHIAVLGQMRELGSFAQEAHLALKDSLLSCDGVFLCGPDMQPLYYTLPAEKRWGYADTSAELAQKVEQRLQQGDAVLFKGANSMQMWTIIEYLQQAEKRKICSIG